MPIIPRESLLIIAIACFRRDKRAGAYPKSKKFYNLPESTREMYLQEAKNLPESAFPILPMPRGSRKPDFAV